MGGGEYIYRRFLSGSFFGELFFCYDFISSGPETGVLFHTFLKAFVFLPVVWIGFVKVNDAKWGC